MRDRPHFRRFIPSFWIARLRDRSQASGQQAVLGGVADELGRARRAGSSSATAGLQPAREETLHVEPQTAQRKS